MRKLRIAQIGMSETTHAAQVFASLAKLKDEFELAGVSDVDAHSRPINPVYDARPRLTVEQLLDLPGLDAVAIECDEALQTRYALMAAERGLHIHLEKPGSEDDRAFDQLIDAVERKRLYLHMGYMYRYNPAVIRVKQLIESGELGRVYSVEAQMNCYHPPAMRKWLGGFKGGMMYYLGCHLVDLIYGIQGLPLEVMPLNACAGADGVESNDYGMAVFKYASGASFAKTSAVEPGGYIRRQLVVTGTEGMVEIKPLEVIRGDSTVSAHMTQWRLDQNHSISWRDEGEKTDFPAYNRYDAMLRGFASIARGDRPNPWPYEYERQLHKLILAACGFNIPIPR